jgi:hypothetical protein
MEGEHETSLALTASVRWERHTLHDHSLGVGLAALDHGGLPLLVQRAQDFKVQRAIMVDSRSPPKAAQRASVLMSVAECEVIEMEWKRNECNEEAGGKLKKKETQGHVMTVVPPPQPGREGSRVE